MTAVIRRVGPEAAAPVLTVVREAFGSRPALDPPADALQETEESIAAALAAGGGLLAEIEGTPAGAVLLDPRDDVTYLRRFGVVPGARRHGVARTLVGAALDAVRTDEVAVLARQELPTTVGFWHDRGFEEIARDAPYVELRRRLVTRSTVVDGEAMRALGERLAGGLRRGDLVVLVGGLGAGKTTLTQGLGAGLGVRGEVTSPTFVIARVHPSLGEGPALVHVDAYRLGGLAELDDLDLDASLDDAVTVVEWGAGLAEALSDSWLEVRIDRATGEGDPLESPEVADPRRVAVRGFGPRWVG
ncbi:tRNA (adenosine(37)-N6)-threonylcarbamoyltransferase complex ATPase subunit type 1 TsaE [Nocardioides sp.]|uniref:tRNA (adenosine(37)-N6)-threonylcarbamoyltransferase complex ATPase subunit type 1 TsaE n=1 Tax=Nocardioides sp. TaxID=35761 RepID=UPI003529CBEA